MLPLLALLALALGGAEEAVVAGRVIAAGEHELVVSARGFATERLRLELRPAERRELTITLTSAALDERVRVVAETAPESGAREVESEQVLRVAGAIDNVFRVLQTLPGVAAPEDFSGRLSVRGGGPDQNLTVLDGVEVHNPYRLFGLVSAFNPETVADFQLMAGGFGARWGDRLSSLLTVETRAGGSELAGSTSLSVTDANVVLEGGWGAGRRWLASARRTTTTWSQSASATPSSRRLPTSRSASTRRSPAACSSAPACAAARVRTSTSSPTRDATGWMR